MCNLYSIRLTQADIRTWFDAADDAFGNLAENYQVYPDYPAPIGRIGADGRRLIARARWGMPTPPQYLVGKRTDPGVTNIRQTTSSHWRPWLGPEHRCLVPFTSFAENEILPHIREWDEKGEVHREVFGRLADLGLVTADDDGVVLLTAAGRSVGAELVAEAGAEVVFRADPAAADAVALVTSMLMLSEHDARADLAAWAGDHPSGAGEVVAAALHPDHGPGDVLSLLELAGEVFGPAADAAAATHRDGPHAPLVTMWLLLRGAIEASTVDPDVMLVGTVEVAAAMLDDAGPEGVVEFFGTDVDQTTDVLEHLWRAEHERTAEVLDVLGHHHPDKRIAKAARRSLMKARGRG